MGKIDYLSVMKSLVPLRYTETFIGSTYINHSKNDYLVFLLKVVHK